MSIDIFNHGPIAYGDIIINQEDNKIILVDDDIARIIAERYNLDDFTKNDMVRAIQLWENDKIKIGSHSIP